MNDRKKVVEWMNKTEAECNTSQLLYKDLHLWPVLKWYLFSNYFNKELIGSKKRNNFSSKQKLRFKNATRAIVGGLFYLKLRLFGIKKIDVLFASASTYRVYLEGKFINRFFQPIAEYFIKEKISFLFADYRVKNFSDYPFKPQHFNIRRLFTFISFKKKGRRIQQDNLLNDIVHRYNKEFDLEVSSNLFYKEVVKILDWAEAYELLLKKTRPALILLICYYDNQMYGLNLAAFRQGVKTVDFQHGGQGDLHVSYAGYNKIPDSGYSCFPGYFWVWDQLSFNNLNKVLSGTSKHKVILGGNPWMNYLDGKLEDNILLENAKKKIILYSLQPISPFIPEIIDRALKETPDNYIWWFRMHPRMTEVDLKGIKDFIRKNNLNEKIITHQPTELPLPLVLKKCLVHVSKSSGCVLEANIIGVPNIIIDPIGLNYYGDLIDDKGNFYLENGNLWSIINKLGHYNPNIPFDFEPALDKLLEDVS